MTIAENENKENAFSGQTSSHRPPLGSAVLKPGFDLRVRHLQTFGQSGPLGAGQILLSVETFLELADLNPGEGCPRLFSLWRGPVLVRVSYPPRDGERNQGRYGKQREAHRWVQDKDLTQLSTE